MTSLELQLKKLKTPASQSLAVSRDFSSLLFDSKQAASYSRQEFYDLGINGLSQLKKFDADFEDYEAQLFDKSCLTVNRAMHNEAEHNDLNEALERIVIRLSPYFHQQACKQVFEWLIYKYQIHRFNAEFLFIALLPYHTSNSFGRLLSILKFNKPEWNFVSEFAKSSSPIPLPVLLRVCVANRSYFLMPVLATFLVNAIKTVGEEYAEKRLHPSFTFFTSFMLNLLEVSAKVDDQLIARILPYVGIALKSKVFAFKCAGLTIVAKLVITTSLTAEVLNNILKLVLLKARQPVMDVVLDTAVLICQTQKVACLPRKAILKLVRKREEISLLSKIQKIRETFELASFLVAFWETLLTSLLTEIDKDFQTDICAVLVDTLDLELMDEEQTTGFLNSLMNYLASSPEAKDHLDKSLRQHIRAIAIRFCRVFDGVRAQWLVRDKALMDLLMKECRIESHEVGEVVIEFSKSKKRRRRTSSTASVKLLDTSYQDTSLVSIIQPNPEDKITAQEKMQKARDEVAVQRTPYKKPVLKLLSLLRAGGDQAELEWALESLSMPVYLNKQLAEDLEQFFVHSVLLASMSVACKSKLKVALARICLEPETVLVLLSELEKGVLPEHRNLRKRSSLAVKSKKEKIAAFFVDETSAQQEKRLVFMLEVLNISAPNYRKATPELVKRLFDLVEKAQPLSSWLICTDSIYFQQLCLLLLGRVLEPAGAARLLFADNVMLDPLVKVIRFTQTPAVLRKALKVLTLVAPIIPAQAVSQFMSLFTFMGDGVLKRDNELTLTVFEETLHALFGALLAYDTGKPKKVDEVFQLKILEISRMLTLSLMDIPAHRRIRILRAVSQQIPHECLWIVLGVLFEDFCIRWEKAKSKRQEKIENLDDVSLELVSKLQPEHQLEVVISLLDYIVKLGGDTVPTNGRAKLTIVTIFDRSLHEIRKLRHFRFVILGFVNKCLNNKTLHEKLSSMSDEVIYGRTVDVGKRLLPIIIQLTDFMDQELLVAEKVEQAGRGTEAEIPNSQALKYWINLAEKTDAASNKLRCLLPANVSGHIICDLLDQKEIDKKMRDKALQLLNVKLMNESLGVEKTKESLKVQCLEGKASLNQYLEKLTLKLNSWIGPAERKEEIALCQKAAFTLKLLAKNVPLTQNSSEIFTYTLENCVKVLQEWSSLDEQLVGSILLLVGELVRSQNLRSILVHVDAVCESCFEILEKCEQETMSEEEDENPNNVTVTDTETDEDIEIASRNSEPSTALVKEDTYLPVVTQKRRRSLRLSASGKQHGDHALLVCAMSCLQPILDQFGDFIPSYYEKSISVVCKLSPKFVPTTNSQSHSKPVERRVNGCILIKDKQFCSIKQKSVCQRLFHMRVSLSKLELRLLLEPFANSIKQLSKKPKRLHSLCLLLEDTLKRNDATIMQRNLEELTDIFLILLSFRTKEKQVKKFQEMNECENAAISAFLALITNLSEKNLTPIVESLSDWVKDAVQGDNTNKSILLTVYQFANRFYEAFNTLALPHFDKLLLMAPKLLDLINASITNKEDLLINGVSEKGSLAAAQANRLILLLTSFIGKCAKHSFYFNEERGELVHEALINQLANSKLEGNEQRCLPHLADCIYQVADACPDLFTTHICNKLLAKTQSNHHKIAATAIAVFRRLVTRIDDSLTSVLPLVIHHFNELTKNSENHPKVKEECGKTISMLKEKFGFELFDEDDQQTKARQKGKKRRHQAK